MEMCLISLIEDVVCINLRYLSSYIRSKGHNTKLVFLPRMYSEGWEPHESYRYPFNINVLQQLEEICANSDIIGLSLMSCHFDNAIHITKFLKKLNKPIIWGGIHPTISPLECLEYADLVCVGEGENSVVALLDHMEKSPYERSTIPGILTRNNQQITVGQPIHNLDDLGFPDFDLDHQFILYGTDIVKLNKTILSGCFNHSYRAALSRGCVSACTYCCNNVIKRLYGNSIPSIRWRSLDKQLEELRWAKESFHNLTEIGFADDTFLSRPYNQIEEFALIYKKEIGLPFKILSTPSAVSYNKIKVLADAGLCHVGIGVQSVYEPVRKMYKRHESLEQIRTASEIFKKVSSETGKPISVRYDFITDNPWGGEKDTEESIRFGMTLKKPRDIVIFSLVFYPGTELYEKAKNEGMIKDELNEVYRVTQLSPKPTYMNEVFSLLAMGCPSSIINILINKQIKIRSIKFVKLIKSAIFIIWYLKNFSKIKPKSQHKSFQFNGIPGEVIQ